MALEYVGRPDGMAFRIGDRRLQLVQISNNAPDRTAMFKIQSTSSRKFRVRPTLGVLRAREVVAVQIQLNPQEREPSECKFLVVIRSVEKEDADGNSVGLIGDGNEATQKAMWKRAEMRNYDSLVFTETITARIVDETPDASCGVPGSGEASVPAAAVAPLFSDGGPVLKTVGVLHSTPSAIIERVEADAPHVVALETLEQRAFLVQLLMKNQSRDAHNQLNAPELAKLRVLRDQHPEQWQMLSAYATRLRMLVREYRASNK